jgi:hypothetical protein
LTIFICHFSAARGARICHLLWTENMHVTTQAQNDKWKMENGKRKMNPSIPQPNPGWEAHLEERWSEPPEAAGSNPALTTNIAKWCNWQHARL